MPAEKQICGFFKIYLELNRIFIQEKQMAVEKKKWQQNRKKEEDFWNLIWIFIEKNENGGRKIK